MKIEYYSQYSPLGVLYRYETVDMSTGSFNSDGDLLHRYPPSTKLYCREYGIIKRTPCGVRIDCPDGGERGRFVLSGTFKQYASETKEKALESYVARQKKYRGILKSRLARIESGLEQAGEVLKNENRNKSKNST